VYKAMLSGVQPVAVKVIPFDASDKERADFDKEVRGLGYFCFCMRCWPFSSPALSNQTRHVLV